MPDVRPVGDTALEAGGLYDPTLVLASRAPVTGNALHADGARAVVITGANQGGKSTFLRSIGLAQVMMRAGMFVAADTYSAGLTPGVHTHFAREEDATLERGKFDEELDRMSRIADRVRAGDLVLFNESFSCTNEREGSAIARVIIDALDENGVRLCFVTHMYDLAHGLALAGRDDLVFLRPGATRRREPHLPARPRRAPADQLRPGPLRPGDRIRLTDGADVSSPAFRSAGRACRPSPVPARAP